MGARRLLRLGVIILVGGAAGLLSLPWGSHVTGWVGPGRVALGASVGSEGRTMVELPPLGRLTAATPSAPVHLRARVDELDVEKVEQLLNGPAPERAFATQANEDLEALLRRMAVRALAVAAVVGAAGVALLPGRRWWFLPIGALAAGAAVGGLGLVSWQRFETEALRQPTFEGALERAPSLLEAAQRHIGDLDDVQDRVRAVSGQIAALYRATGRVDLGRADSTETRILHVSDIHLNPLALEFVARWAEDFDVDAVLDTGDLTSFGSPIEARIGSLVRAVPVRYLFVPGNHDSTANRAAIGAIANVELLDGATATVGSVKILGVADPTFTASNETSTREANDEKLRLAPRVRGLVRRNHPDVLAVHDSRQAQGVEGLVPLVLAGHTHHRGEKRKDGTSILTVGSTGAGGLGSFTVDTSEPYEAELLHFRKGVLVAVDYITLEGISGNLTIEREVRDEVSTPKRPNRAEPDSTTR